MSKKKVEIEKLAKELAGATEDESSKEWIGYYQIAKKTIKEELTDEEREAYLNEVSNWQTLGVPKDVQSE